MNRLIQDLKNAWRNTNTATVGFLQSIPSEKVSDIPFDPRFTKYAWEFACLIRTRLCYLDELNTGIQNFSSRLDIPEKEVLMNLSKSEILDHLSQTSNAILTQIDLIADTVNLPNNPLSSGDRDRGTSNTNPESKLGRIIWLLQHERIHQGKFILYHSKSGYEIPESFKKTWGESNF